MSKEYDITEMTDLLEIPEDKIDAVLADMKEWYLLAKALSSNMPEGVSLKHQGFIWVDDNIHGVSDILINGQSVKEAAQ